MSGFVGGAFNHTGIILVLFILLVIIACSCGIFGGWGGSPYVGGANTGYGNVAGANTGYGNVAGVNTGYGNVAGANVGKGY
ncbi:hypothetical protein [Paenibacillus sp. NPDC058071]|uniref:hypothetical protein n=1 Tax=Paenibacillus sp. NPDC058071 TaxID=3346326 RepID=UPI0036DCE7C7